VLSYLKLDNILSFLFFGYLPKLPSDLETKVWALATAGGDSLPVKDGMEESLLENGISIFKSIFTNVEDSKHIVPLSGGLDSRAILGGLLAAGLKDQITTVTYGTPGTFDYDIGCDIARQMGLRHERLDLTQVKIEQSLLEKTAKEMGTRAWIFDAFYNRLIPKRFGKNAIYWTGFFGDVLAGYRGCLLPQDSSNWEKAVSHFIEYNRFVRSVNLVNPNFDPSSVLPRSPLLQDSILSYDEQLFFAIRIESYMRHILAPNDYDYRTPYLHPEWVNFILNVPRKLRRNKYLYQRILATAFPDLFSLPTRNDCGFPLNTPNWRTKPRRGFWKIKNIIRRRFPFCMSHCDPRINYIDFDEAIRQRKDFKEVVGGNIHDLRKRGIIDWIDIEDLLEQHQQRCVNCADAITILVSLEIILKVNEQL